MLLNRRSLGNRGYGGYGLGGNSVGLLSSRARGLGGGLGGPLGYVGPRRVGGGLLPVRGLGGFYRGPIGGYGTAPLPQLNGYGQLGPFNGILSQQDINAMLLQRLAPRFPTGLLPDAPLIPGLDLCEGCVQNLLLGNFTEVVPACSCGNRDDLWSFAGYPDPYFDYAYSPPLDLLGYYPQGVLGLGGVGGHGLGTGLSLGRSVGRLT